MFRFSFFKIAVIASKNQLVQPLISSISSFQPRCRCHDGSAQPQKWFRLASGSHANCAVQPFSIMRDKTASKKRTHAVPQKNMRNALKLVFRKTCHLRHRSVHAADTIFLRELTQFPWFCCPSMSRMIVPDDRNPRPVHRLCKFFVSANVLDHTVRHLNDRPRCFLRLPADAMDSAAPILKWNIKIFALCHPDFPAF